jgi:tetratricopeptide (TPR) repeat protein
VHPATLCPIQAIEILRCTVLALRRRAMLLGPAGPGDALTNQALAALMRRPGPPNHWSEAWVDLELGTALMAAGKETQALPYLNRALVAGGQFDHPLTCVALLELGQIYLGQGNFTAAIKHFEEASYAAVEYLDMANLPDLGVLEEAFRYAAVAHLMANHAGIYPPLRPALEWAKRFNARYLETSLELLLAENCIALRQTGEAGRFLSFARQTVSRQAVAGWIGARLNFLAATAAYQQGQTGRTEGDNALSAAMTYMRGGSLWLFQIGLVDGRYLSGALTPRAAMDLYQKVLRDPLAPDWNADPMESLAVLMTPHPASLERWFDVAIKRKDNDAALEIADRARRHRYFSTLAFGGRLQSLRWILGAPVETLDQLDQHGQLNRQDLLLRYPQFEQLAKQAGQVRARLMARPLVAQTPQAVKEQTRNLSELAAISTQQEAILREIAVRRDPAGLIFPPTRSTQQVQKALAPGHAILVFFSTSDSLYGFLLDNQRYTNWRVSLRLDVISQKIAELLRQMGNYGQNKQMTHEILADEKWKKTAQGLLDLLLKGSQADFAHPFEELTIVPDGLMWYVPFESLQVAVGKDLYPLISRVRVRYVPTLSLAMPDGRGRKLAGRTGVVVGQLYSRDAEPSAQTIFEQISKVLPDTVALTNPLPAPSAYYSSLLDRLIVLDQVAAPESPYGWSPITFERSKGSTVNDWLALPWEGPETLVLPAFHTASENSLKGVTLGAAGNEMFLTVCGLMSCGVRTILISRWRTGGQTSGDLVREFVQELPHAAASEAWQRSVFLTAEAPLNLDAEPRFKHTAGDKNLRADHPFFWSGYLLVDSAGEIPREPVPDEPVVKIKNAGQAQAPDKKEAPLDQPGALKLPAPPADPGDGPPARGKGRRS